MRARPRPRRIPLAAAWPAASVAFICASGMLAPRRAFAWLDVRCCTCEDEPSHGSSCLGFTLDLRRIWPEAFRGQASEAVCLSRRAEQRAAHGICMTGCFWVCGLPCAAKSVGTRVVGSVALHA
mmetsp:Transcript_39113/g.110684  ORF Transcript_39113/g.110684 Transcript_39113/m.110684 type:complete len:124 (+) Transcript_39113:497-868(+)